MTVKGNAKIGVKYKYNALYDAVSQVGSVQIRNVATIGGNICSSLPSADCAGPLLTMEAKAKIIGLNSEKVIPLSDFFLGPGENILQNGEILYSIEVPIKNDNVYSAYIKHGRRKSMEIALIGATVLLEINDEGDYCLDAKMALTTAAPTPIRASKAEMFLRGKKLNMQNIERAGLEAVEDAVTRDSYRCTAAYRNKVIPTLVKRAITTALERGGVGIA